MGKERLSLFALGAAVLAGLYLSRLHSYLLFHSIVEIFSVAVAAAIFMIAWNSRRFMDNNYPLFLGISFLFVGGLDLIHTLAYKGMGIIAGSGVNLPTQLWIAARYLGSLSLLIAPLFLRRTLKLPYVFAGYAAATTLLLLSIFTWRIFPDSFVEGRGLTPFKIASEYAICLILAAAIGFLLKNGRELDRRVLRWLVVSMAATIASELSFTLYTDPYGLTNLIGHYLKIVSFYFIYKAIVETGLDRPYDLLFRRLKQSEERYRSLFSHLADGFAHHRILLDAEGRPVDYLFLETNEAFERLMGLDRRSLIGRKATEVLPGVGKDPADWIGAYGKVALGGGAMRLESYAAAPDRWYSVLAYSPERGTFATVFEDITERKRLEGELRAAKERADEASQAKSEFLAHMSHELRTPISAIIGLSEVLAPRIRNPQNRQFLSLILESARSLLALIGDILDLSRIENRKVELHPGDFSLRRMLEQLVSTYTVAAGRKGLTLSLAVGEKAPDRVRGDAELLSRVLRNLLSNAIKYTERGSVQLRVDPAGRRGRRWALRFAVADTGIGIPPGKRGGLFQSFSRLHAGEGRNLPEGTGLGLAISQGLVNLMGGAIEVESREGEGSTFSFTVWLDAARRPEPVAREPASGEPAPARPANPLAGLPPLEVLLAEDNLQNRTFLQSALQEAGHRLEIAQDGLQAFQAIQRRRFDLVLMDIQMARMDGLEATRRIRSLAGEAGRVPIVALTAYALKGDECRLLEAGMDGYVPKPVDFQRLARVIRQVCLDRRGGRAAGRRRRRLGNERGEHERADP